MNILAFGGIIPTGYGLVLLCAYLTCDFNQNAKSLLCFPIDLFRYLFGNLFVKYLLV